jgi:hypothetical protein
MEYVAKAMGSGVPKKMSRVGHADDDEFAQSFTPSVSVPVPSAIT